MTTVLYADDEETARAKFVARHAGSDWFVSAYEGSLKELPHQLESRSQLPDLLVLDLYDTKAPPGSSEAQEVNQAVEVKIRQIDELVEELRRIVDAGKEPRGLSLLREIRQSRRRALRQMPVMLFTRQGLALLDDEELKDSHELDATWMVKNRSVDLERAAMRHALSKRPRLARDVVIGTVFCLIGVVATILVGVAFS